jgi:hypothetical protein
MDEERRVAILWLLEHRNDHLPTMPVRRIETAPGFVNEERPSDCPDCRANGRIMFGCETCGGSGHVTPARLSLVSSADEDSVNDGSSRDPYAKNETVLPFGFDPTRHDAERERDRQIARLGQQTSPARSESELLDEANKRGYAWEEQRRTMYRVFDFAALDLALDKLRAHDVDAAHALNAVYIDGWLAEVGQITPLAEQLCERALLFLAEELPTPLRSDVHPAVVRMARKRDRLKQEDEEAA